MRFEGVYTALITPMEQSGKVDFKGLAANIETQVEAGVDGIVVLGTTGEAPTLKQEEQEKIISSAMEQAGDKVSVVAGCGTNSTAATISNVNRAASMGASAALVVCPYYNCPTQEGIYSHYMAIAEQSDLPIILYNIPKRCGRAVSSETIARLLDKTAIAAVKDSTNDMELVQSTITLSRKTTFSTVLSGDDPLTLPMLSLGADGVVSVLSNVLPREVVAMVKAARAGDYREALRWHEALLPMMRACFVETNPSPIKALMDLAGYAGGPPRLPLCPVSQSHLQYLSDELARFKRGCYAS